MNDFDKEYLNMGYKSICGVDEVGRGPLFGPVVACALIMKNDYFNDEITDSKKLTEKKRTRLYDEIVKNCIDYGFGVVSAQTIDEINIKNATKMAMAIAVNSLKIKPDIILIDAESIETDTCQKSIIKGDEKSFVIGAASILAKVHRDNMMSEMDSYFPGYGIGKHKGYGTKFHIEKILELGPTKEHRLSFLKKIIK